MIVIIKKLIGTILNPLKIVIMIKLSKIKKKTLREIFRIFCIMNFQTIQRILIQLNQKMFLIFKQVWNHFQN